MIPLQQQSNISSFWCLSLLLLTINLAWHDISKLQICLCSWFTWWFKTLTWNEVVPRIIVHYWYSRCQQIYMPSLNGTIITEITVQHKCFYLTTSQWSALHIALQHQSSPVIHHTTHCKFKEEGIEETSAQCSGKKPKLLEIHYLRNNLCQVET